jgi:hypothetical protein
MTALLVLETQDATLTDLATHLGRDRSGLNQTIVSAENQETQD